MNIAVKPKIGTLLRRGFSLACRRWAVVRLIFVVNLILAAVVAMPVYYAVSEFTGHSRMATALLEGFSPEWFTDLQHNRPSWLSLMARTTLAGGLFGLLFNALLAGGMLGSFRDPEQNYSGKDFFQAVVRHAGRLLRLLLLGLLCYWLMFWLLNVEARAVLGRLTTDEVNELWSARADVFLSVLLVAGLLYLNLILDFARLRLVLGDKRSALSSAVFALRFVHRNRMRSLMVYSVPGLCGLFLLGLYLAAVSQLSVSNLWIVGLLFLIQQGVMFGRYWFRMAAWAGEWVLLKEDGTLESQQELLLLGE